MLVEPQETLWVTAQQEEGDSKGPVSSRRPPRPPACTSRAAASAAAVGAASSGLKRMLPEPLPNKSAVAQRLEAPAAEVQE